MSGPAFTVGGLASGLDSNSIIDKLVQLESLPLTTLKTRQAAFTSQISKLGDLTSKLSALQTAAAALGANGALGLKTASANTAFTAVPGSSGVAGTFDVAVTSLATAAKWRSTAFAATDVLAAGTFHVAIAGTSYDVDVAAGATLADVAFGLRQKGAPVSAVVLNDGTSSYLSVTATNTGYSGNDPASALAISFTAGDGNKDPTVGGDVVSRAATNARFSVDGLQFTRTSNVVSDALPGTTLTLAKASALDGAGQPLPETLAIANDVDATAAKLKTFVDAYNGVMTLVQSQLAPGKDTDRAQTLAGEGSVRSLQSALQALGSTAAGTLATVRTLADAGLKTGKDGTLSVDTTVLASALARDPAALNALFADRASGVAKLSGDLVSTYGAAGTGLLALRQKGLQDQVRDLGDQADRMQARLDGYRADLVKQFTAMESVVSGFKSVGAFLTQQWSGSSN